MSGVSTKSVVEYIYNGDAKFTTKEYELLKSESKNLLNAPLKVMALLIAVSGLFAMIFEVQYFSQFAVHVYVTRLTSTLIAFLVLVIMYTRLGKEKPLLFVHVLLMIIIISSGYMIYLMPKTLVINSEIVGLMIFTSALFLSWDVKNQIIVAIYYNIVFAAAILLNNNSIYFLPNMYESVLFVLFLSIVSVIGAAVNFKLRMQLAERSYKIELSEQKYHSIFDNSAEGIFQSSLEGRFLTVNNALADILGYESKEQLLKVNIAKDIYKTEEDRIKLARELKEKGYVKNYKIALKKKGGGEVFVRLNDKLISDGNGNGYYYEGNMFDITEQVVAEEELKAEKIKSDSLAKEATQATLLKSQFLANMSHEIRTPMNGVLGYLTLIEQEAYDNIDEMKTFASSARQSAESLLEIINDILDLSKIESGRMELESTNFDLKNVISESISLLNTKALEKGLVLKTDFKDELINDLIGDPTRLRQILINLINNAIKFTRKGEIRLNVSTEAKDSNQVSLNISVSDTGIGISKDKIINLFKPFSQLDKSHTRKFGGTGLGLVICKEFINLMGGEISVESEEGKGSIFYFTVKLKAQTGQKPSSGFVEVKKITEQKKLTTEKKGLPVLKKDRNKFSVLLAEDNLINQKVAVRILSDAGFNITAVENGVEVINYLKTQKPDLILMDVQMPEMDGFTATKEIRKLNTPVSNIPIVALTAHALVGDKDKCLAAGMNDYVSKPIIPEKLIGVLDKWLDVNSKKVEVVNEKSAGQDVVFDFDALAKMCMGDKEFEKELLTSYIEDITNRLGKLNNFILNKNMEKIVNEAHTIKGASYSIGAKAVGDEALGIELSGKHNDIENINQRIGSLTGSINTTKEILKKYLS